MVHIPPGLVQEEATPFNISIEEQVTSLWHANFTKKYLDLMDKYNVNFTIGGHLMQGDLRILKNHTLFINPSVSPDKSTNPGFSIIDFEEGRLVDIEFNHL